MGLGRVELPTSRLSGVRSNHLSYRPLQRVAKASREQDLSQPSHRGFQVSPAISGTEIAAVPAAILRSPSSAAEAGLTGSVFSAFGDSAVWPLSHASQTRSPCLIDLEAAS